ncbi:MAG: GNAT family N-acetyltransferase [Cytophagales bacterium]
MNIRIRKYNSEKDYPALIKLIKSEGEEWQDYLKPVYILAMDNSISYVATADDTLCGYSRSVYDSGLFIWVIDLLVHKNFRGHAIGKQLMDCILKDFPKCDVYVMSDVDGYYHKLGYDKEGSIFKVKGN